MNRTHAALIVSAALSMASQASSSSSSSEFSDPTKRPPTPADAKGYPSRDAQLDALPGFRNPPPGTAKYRSGGGPATSWMRSA